MVVLNIGGPECRRRPAGPATKASPDRHATLCRVHVAIVEKRLDVTGLIRPAPIEKNNTHALPFVNLHGSGRNVLAAKNSVTELVPTQKVRGRREQPVSGTANTGARKGWLCAAHAASRFLRGLELSTENARVHNGSYAVPSGTSSGVSPNQSRGSKYQSARCSGVPGSGCRS